MDKLDLEERRMLTAGLFWAYWQKNNTFWKNRADDFTGVGVKAARGKTEITAGNLFNICRWAGLIPLSPEEQKDVEDRLNDPNFARRLLEERLGAEVGSKIDLKVVGPLFWDRVVESVLDRNLKKIPEKDLDAQVRDILGDL